YTLSLHDALPISPPPLSYGTGLIYSLPQLLAEHWASHSMTRHGGISSQRTRSSANSTTFWKSYERPPPSAIRCAEAIFQGRIEPGRPPNGRWWPSRLVATAAENA